MRHARVSLNKARQWLFAVVCVNPDLARLPTTVSLTLCNGTLAKGQLDLSALSREKIAMGKTIGGVTGTAPSSIPVCASDGEIDCLTHAGFRAGDVANLLPGNIKVGVNLGGMAGSFDASSPICSSSGEFGCVTTLAYKAADLSSLTAANIRNGVTVAGMTGSYPSGSAPLNGSSSMTDLVSLDASTPAGTYEFFDSVGTRYTGVIADVGTISPGVTVQTFNTALYRPFTVSGDSDLNGANIRSGVTIFGVAGSMMPAPPPCSANNETDCVTTVAYKAADLSNLSAGNVKFGATVAGVLGDYPSGAHLLAGASPVTADLQSFASAAGSTSYEWFQADGTRLTDRVEDDAFVSPNASTQTLNAGLYRSISVDGDGDLLAANIRSGITIFGVTGNLAPSAANCAADGQTNCVVTGSYKAGDALQLLPGNIKDAVVIGGVTGNLTGAPANCTSNGQVGCVTTPTYKSADLANLAAGNIKTGVSIAGVVGTYPSIATPLDANTATTDLTSLAASTPAGSYEFFDSTGTRYVGAIADAGTIVIGTSDQSFGASAYRGFRSFSGSVGDGRPPQRNVHLTNQVRHGVRVV